MRFQNLKFKGEDGSMGFIKDETYMVDVRIRTKPQRIAGVLLGIPYSWEVIVMSPKIVPYGSWAKFRQNWGPTNQIEAFYKESAIGLTGMKF